MQQSRARCLRPESKQIVSQIADKWLGLAAIAVGWLLAAVDVATLHAVSTTATFELTAFAALAFGFGAGWCARGGRR